MIRKDVTNTISNSGYNSAYKNLRHVSYDHVVEFVEENVRVQLLILCYDYDQINIYIDEFLENYYERSE